MLATSTHDSKRSEDVRTRIDVLSEIPEQWKLRVREWKRLNRRHRMVLNGKPAPSPNDEYLLYQTLIGSWPSAPMVEETDRENYCKRIENYMLKAVREAKQHTSWLNRNLDYENAITSFVRSILDPDDDNRFLEDFLPFQRRLSRIGLWNSLSQTLLKLTSPGVPDIYQGNELWDFSLVDPDNRRSVDYKTRRRLLENLRKEHGVDTTHRLLETPEDGRLKLYLIWKTLCLRRQNADLFQRGEYLPLAAQGKHAGHVVAFAWKTETSAAIVLAPRLVAGLLGAFDTPPLGPRVWDDTRVFLPFSSKSGRYRNVLTGNILATKESAGELMIEVASMLADFPVALLSTS